VTPYFADEFTTVYLGDMRDVLPFGLDFAPTLVLTDPPYGDTSLEWDRWPGDWTAFVPPSVDQMWCFGSMRMLLDHAHEFRSVGWKYAQEVVWEKHNGSGFADDRFKRVHEFATHWYRGPWGALTIEPQYIDEATKRTVRRKERPPHTGEIAGSTYTSIDGGPKLQRSVIYARSAHGQAIHPTEKVQRILEPLIRYSTKVGDTILDPFAGSLSTARVARLVGRKSVCIEANEKYLERAVTRLTSELALHGGAA
jgi:site-specific DNA-methyltransferase (adenine-specific)